MIETFKEYQQRAQATATYSPDFGIVYACLGLAGEAGEFVDKIKKMWRNLGIKDPKQLPEEKRLEMAKELGDVLWYLSDAAGWLGYSLSEVASLNVQKLEGRKARNVIKSEGDNR